MDTLFFILYALATLINILSIRYDKYTVRFVSKICLMPILILFYILKSNDLSFAITLAMIFSWCGDILLVNPLNSKLYAGISSFLIAHILYIFAFIELTPEVNIIIFIFSFLLISLIECFFIIKLHIQNNYRIFIIVYGLAIGLLVVFSLQVFILYKSISGILFVIGSVLFLVSDAVLVYFNTIRTMTKNSLAVVMLSYIVAQAFIVIGYINI